MKFSIITPSLNQCRYLNQTLRSILSQTGDFALEAIVIDGGSSDGTLELLRACDDPRLIWTSQADRGQAHAINLGLARASGDVVAWLNSDDFYAPGALAAVADAFTAAPHAMWLIGRCTIIDADGREIRAAITRYKDGALRRYSRRLLLRENFISQPAVFWRRGFGQRIGPLDESLHYTMDYDLWLRMAGQSVPLRLDRVLAKFRIHPSSKSGRRDRRQFDEQYAVASRYFGDDHLSRLVHRLNVEKIVWTYRLMRFLAR